METLRHGRFKMICRVFNQSNTLVKTMGHCEHIVPQDLFELECRRICQHALQNSIYA